ncbi:MAG: hypothetical protein B7Z80_26870, partial [Rhodospirillales bacterium 20-64-7]
PQTQRSKSFLRAFFQKSASWSMRSVDPGTRPRTVTRAALIVALALIVIRILVTLVLIVMMSPIALVAARPVVLAAVIATGAVVGNRAGMMVIARPTRSMILPTIITAGTVIRTRTRTMFGAGAGAVIRPVARPGMVIGRAAAWAAEAVLIIAARQATGEHSAKRNLGEHLFHATEMVGAFQRANPNA